MGLTASTGYGSSGAHDHFVNIVQPKSSSGDLPAETNDLLKDGLGKSVKSLKSLNARESMTVSPSGQVNDENDNGNGRTSSTNSPHVVLLDSRALIIKKLDSEKLWNSFVDNSSILSFALSESDVIALMKDSLLETSFEDLPENDRDSLIEDAINNYLELVRDLAEHTNAPNMLDFMSILSSVLLLAPKSISYKIDKLYGWITLMATEEGFNFSQFFVALSSFERGLSYAMGHKSFPEDAIKNLAKDWIALADPQHKGTADPYLSIKHDQFSDFCSNRHIVVRKVLEGLTISETVKDDNRQIKEAVTEAVGKSVLHGKPAGGDQWMANPAWKSTANKMLPKSIQHIGEKPNTTLQLEWVHGYRGYDCRNNLRYLSSPAASMSDTIFYHAAALGIAMESSSETSAKSQVHFSEHRDDVLCVDTFEMVDGDENRTLIATGEVGKNPAIHLYVYDTTTKHFESLCTMKGFHTKGVVQLSFSNTGKTVFTVGADYTIAVYNTDISNESNFGRMITSARGPKGKVLHCCSLIPYHKDEGDFLSCGEKHITYWTNNQKSKKLEMQEVKLGSFKRDYAMCCARLRDANTAVVGTSQGDVLYIQSATLMGSNCGDGKANSSKKLHSKAINAIHSMQAADGEFYVITGGHDGKVCLLRQKKYTEISERELALELLGVFYVETLYQSAKNIIRSHGEILPSESMEDFNVKHFPIRSVSLSQDLSKCLVGTQACEIIEFSRKDMNFVGASPEFPDVTKLLWGHSIKGTVKSNKHKKGDKKEVVYDERHLAYQNSVTANTLMYGHYKEELWGLAIRPTSASETAPQEAGTISPRIYGSPKAEYCTVGDDGILRVWELNTRKLKMSVDLKISSRCCTYSPDGHYLAVGLGGSMSHRKNKHNGGVRIFRADTLDQVVELKEAKQWISCIKFSPDGSTLAVGSRDNSVYVYSVAQQFKRKAKFCKHAAGIMDLDFSMDSKYIQSTCTSYELLFSDTVTGAQITHGESQFASEHWDTFTCTLGWPVIGIWEPGMDGSDVNSVDRNVKIIPGRKSNRHNEALLATGDDFGGVHVYQYPATIDGGSPSTTYRGHSSHVTTVRWASSSDKNEDYLITVGGNDKCVFQWKCVEGVQVGERQLYEAEQHDSNLLKATEGPKGIEREEVSAMLATGPAGGDEFMAVKPWLGAIRTPTAWVSQVNSNNKVDPFYANLGTFVPKQRLLREPYHDGDGKDPENGEKVWPPTALGAQVDLYENVSSTAKKVYDSLLVSGLDDSSQPDSDELELEWVHGYRGFDVRNNVFYINDDSLAPGTRSVLYHGASLGIKMTIAADGSTQQSYFRGHNDDITGMTTMVTGCKCIVATGQQGKGCTYVWEAASMKTVGILHTKQKTVSQLMFSKHNGGRFLVTCAEDSSIAVSDWKSQSILVLLKKDAAHTFHMSAPGHLSDKRTFGFVTVGDKFIKYWGLTGRNLVNKKVAKGPKMDRKVATSKFLCTGEAYGRYLTGCEDGKVYFFFVGSGKYQKLTGCFDGAGGDGVKEDSGKSGKSGRKRSNKNHILSMFVDEANCRLITGCRDGTIAIFGIPRKWADDPDSADIPSLLHTFNVTEVMTRKEAEKEAGDFSFGSTIAAKQVHALSSFVSGSPESRFHLLISTRGCDLFEVCVDLEQQTHHLAEPADNATSNGIQRDLGVLVRGHCNNELWGLACHPLLPIYASVGDDMTLRLYNVTTRKMLKMVPLGSVSRACAYSPDGCLLAVGFGGRLGRGDDPKGGMVRLYPGNFDDMADLSTVMPEKLCEVNDAKQWVSDVKFSSDSMTLVVGAHDCKIYIYDVRYTCDRTTAGGKLKVVEQAALSLRALFTKHSSVINHLDISQDGRYLQSNCSAYELLFCDLQDGKQVTSASELKDMNWATWTCTLGWPVQGIWSNGMDGSDINAVARSHTGHLLATSDDFGKVHLFRYPCIKENSVSLNYSGHSSHVMNVRWTAGDECLISCGGNDKTVMQWKHIMTPPDRSEDALAAHHDSSMKELGLEDSALSLLQGPIGGDESGAVKPWLGAVRTPKNPPVINNNEPPINAHLHWVHGFTSGVLCNTKVSSTLYYAPDGEPIYPAASMGIRLLRGGSPSQENWQQQFFRGHDDDILCMAISKDRRFVATGQTASNKRRGAVTICVWDALDCHQLCRIDKCHQRGVVSLAFNEEGTQLLSVGQDNKYTHKIWDDIGGNWCRVRHSATVTSDQSPVLFSLWLHKEHASQCQMISGGVKTINFWQLEGASLVKKAGRFGKAKKSAVMCAANIKAKDDKSGSTSWQVVVGTKSGDLYLFNMREVSNIVANAHGTEAVMTLRSGVNSKGQTYLVSGGKDCKIRTWNEALQKVAIFDVTSYCLNMSDASIMAIDIRPPMTSTEGGEEEDNRLHLLVGTTGGDVIELVGAPAGDSESSETSLQISSASVEKLVSSHFSGELWGLAAHPSIPDLYCTVGDDGTLRIWSIKYNRCLHCETLGYPARCVTWAQIPVVDEDDDVHAKVEYKEIIAIGFYDAEGRNKRSRRGRRNRKAKQAWAEKKDGQEKEGEEGVKAAHTARPFNRVTSAVMLYSVAVDEHSGTVAMQYLSQGCHSDAWINDIKISTGPDPWAVDGSNYEGGLRPRLGVASHDSNLYIYNLPYLSKKPDNDSPTKAGGHGDSNRMTEADLQLKLHENEVTASGVDWEHCLDRAVVFTKHSSAVVHFDFSRDGTYIQSNCQAGELLFASLKENSDHEAVGIKQETSATKMAEFHDQLVDADSLKHWETQSCVLGWPVQGILAPGSDSSDINAADRDLNQQLLATGDDFGGVNIFRYPVVNEGAKCTTLTGHASHVTCVRFTMGDTLLSVGGNDQCTIVWKYDKK